MSHLAIQSMDKVHFRNPKYMMHVELRDLMLVNQSPMRVTLEVELWLKEWALTQERIGLLQRAGSYEELPVVTTLLTVPG